MLSLHDDYMPADEFGIVLDWAVNWWVTYESRLRDQASYGGSKTIGYRETLYLHEDPKVWDRCKSINDAWIAMLNVYGTFHDVPYHYDNSPDSFFSRIVILNLWGAARFYYTAEKLTNKYLDVEFPNSSDYVEFSKPNQAFVMPGDYLHAVHTQTERGSLILRYT